MNKVKKEFLNPNDLQNITFLDFETTGLKDPMPVSLALIRMKNDKNIYAKYFLINPEKSIDYSAYLVHKISKEMVEKQPNFVEVWKEIKPYISGQIVVGHNVRYDSGVIVNCIRRYGLDCEPYHTICTCDNAKKMIAKEDVPNYKLDTVCDYFNIKLETHHDARDDTNACRLIFNKLRNLGPLESKLIDNFA